jgi:hypothetical protein
VTHARKHDDETASTPNRNDPANSSGTRNSRHFAMNTSAAASTAPTTVTLMTNAATPSSRVSTRKKQVHPQSKQHHQPQCSGELDQRQVRSGVLQHGGLMDHRQLQMGAGVVLPEQEIELVVPVGGCHGTRVFARMGHPEVKSLGVV